MEYKVGDAVEFIYKRVIGEGDIVKIIHSLFGKKYLIKTVVEKTYINGHITKIVEVLEIKEKYIIKKLD